MGQRLIDNKLTQKVVVVLTNSDDWKRVEGLVNDELFVDWSKYVFSLVIPKATSAQDQQKLIDEAIAFCNSASEVHLILPVHRRKKLVDWLEFVPKIVEKLDKEITLTNNVALSKHPYKTAPAIVDIIVRKLHRYKFTSLDKKIADTLGTRRIEKTKFWLAQWTDVSLAMRQIGEQILRNVWLVNEDTLLERVKEVWLGKLDPDISGCPTVVFFEEDTHDSNTALENRLLIRYEHLLGDHFQVLNVSKNNCYKVFSVINHRRNASTDLMQLKQGELVLVDECNISGHKAYGKDRVGGSQLTKMKELAETMFTATNQVWKYRLWFAYSTETALSYKLNTAKHNERFNDDRFCGVGASTEDDFLRPISNAAPMAFQNMTECQIKLAVKFAEQFPKVVHDLRNDELKSLSNWKGGYLTSFFLPASTPADNFPPLIHEADWRVVAGVSLKWTPESGQT